MSNLPRLEDYSDVIKGYLIHLSYNMWADVADPGVGGKSRFIGCRPYLRCDRPLWDDIIAALAGAGASTILIDIGDGVRYRSRPEIAVEGAWSVDELKGAIARIRDLGMEALPKLNFSTTHDTWLGEYHRCVSTPTYYAVCADLIAETIELFDGPPLFHLGMDEEDLPNQRFNEHVTIRQGDLWWRDLEFLAGEVEKGGARPWIWSDYYWSNPESFRDRMPRSIVQSNWYYSTDFSEEKTPVRTYLELDRLGYDQIPTGSNWESPENFPQTVRFCQERLDAGRVLGFLQTVWQPTLEECRGEHMEAVAALGEAFS